MKYYTSELYYGRYPVWSDFVEEWDVAFQEKEQCFDWVEEDCDSKIVAVVGGAYVGKTVFARRLLFDLHKKGYEAYEYDFKSSLELRLLKEYIELLPIGSNIAILVEDAAMQYKQIVDFMSNKPTNIGKIVFILVSKAYYHDMKKHEMIGTKFKEIVIKSKMNYNMANNVFDRLKEKRRLGELNRYGSTDSEKIKFIKERASIIDVLYRLFHGRGFEEYFSECYKQLNVQEVYRSFFDEICVLYRMGFENYPKELQVMLPGGVDIRKFLNEFEDIIVKDDRENLQIRCAEVFENIVCNKLSSSQKKEIILKYLYSFVGLFDEGEENEWNIFFEKLLKTDALMHKVKLNNDDIEEIFALLETKYDRISYYWMQRGLFVQKLDQFENANTFLNNAQQIQKRSYQIRHALAKNEMEWAVFELRDQYYGSAAYHYEKGERMFLELINSPKYSRALGYSIHSYVNLKIEYFKNYHEVLSDEAINDLYEYLIQVAMIDYSDAVCQAVKKTYDYCVAKNISTDITEKFQDNNFKQYKALYKQLGELNF